MNRLAAILAFGVGILSTATAAEPTPKSSPEPPQAQGHQKSYRAPCMVGLAKKGLPKGQRRQITRAVSAIAKANKTCRTVADRLQPNAKTRPTRRSRAFIKGRKTTKSRSGLACKRARRIVNQAGTTEEQKVIRDALKTIRRMRTQCRKALETSGVHGERPPASTTSGSISP